MTPTATAPIVRLALPKGRMERNVFDLLGDAGVSIQVGSRAYRPSVSLTGFDTKILKPQNIVEMLHVGSRDIGFAGADWVQELGVEVVELLDTAFDPVRLVAAAPVTLLQNGRLPDRPLLAATEYERIVTPGCGERGLDARVVRTFGATEVFPPEDADFIVDVAATGSTLAANGLVVFDELLTSSTRLFACPRSLDDSGKRERIERFVMLLRLGA